MGNLTPSQKGRVKSMNQLTDNHLTATDSRVI